MFWLLFVYMNSTTTIHVKTDIKTRDTAKQVAEEFGFTLTSLVNALLRQVARTRRLTLNLEETPTPEAVEMLKQSEEDFKAGRVKHFKSGQEAVAYVHSLIKDEK